MPGGNRDSAREHVAALLAVGRTVAEVAHQTTVSESTIRRWLRTSEFRASVEELRSQAVSETVGTLGGAAREAALQLVELLTSAAEGIRLRAAVAMLDQLVKYRTLSSIEQRLAELEARLGEQGRPR